MGKDREERIKQIERREKKDRRFLISFFLLYTAGLISLYTYALKNLPKYIFYGEINRQVVEVFELVSFSFLGVRS